MKLAPSIGASFAMVACACGCAAEPVGEWAFDVLLDGRRIGEHRFSVTTDGERTLVRSRAGFEVKLLGFTAYRYRHESDEVWRHGCLESVRAQTNDDGEASRVDAEPATGGGLRVSATKGVATYPGCVKGFGYWNPAILDQRRLLNVQTGEYVAVSVTPLPDQPVLAGGQMVPARRWRLSGAESPLELWYASADERWLALESTVSGGRKLTYRLR